MTETAVQKYERLKQTLARRREDIAELKGRRSQLMSRLATEFNCESVDEADAKLKRAREKFASLRAQFEEMVDGLESSLAGG